MLNIDLIRNNKVSEALPINSSSISGKKSGTVKLIVNTKNKGSNINPIKKSIVISYPKTLSEKVSILKYNANSLKSLNNKEKLVVIKNKNIGEITPKNILKSFFYRKLVTITPIYDKTSFFYDNRKKSTTLVQVERENINNNNNFLLSNKLNEMSLFNFIKDTTGQENNLTNNNLAVSNENVGLNGEVIFTNNSLLKSEKLNKNGIGQIAMQLALKAKLSNSIEFKKEIDRLSRLRRFTNFISKFNADVANYQYLYYNFKKSNKVVIQPFISAYNILRLSFFIMGCLISKPVFKVVYSKNKLNKSDDFKLKARKKVIIQLFYYVKFKPSYNSLRRLIMKFIAKPNIISPDYSFNSKLKKSEMANLLTNLDENPQFKHTLRKMKKYDTKNFFARYAYKFEFLAACLTKLFRSEVQLDLIRLYKPYLDANILVQDLNLRSYTNRFYGVTKRLFKFCNIKSSTIVDSGRSYGEEDVNLNPLTSSNITGIHVKLGGRSFQQRIVPRRTVKQIQRGSLSKSKVKFLQKARFTGKVKRGSYSFTVTVGHAF
jgi:Mitochondrial ribosomal protein (VAR1)